MASVAKTHSSSLAKQAGLLVHDNVTFNLSVDVVGAQCLLLRVRVRVRDCSRCCRLQSPPLHRCCPTSSITSNSCSTPLTLRHRYDIRSLSFSTFPLLRFVRELPIRCRLSTACVESVCDGFAMRLWVLSVSERVIGKKMLGGTCVKSRESCTVLQRGDRSPRSSVDNNLQDDSPGPWKLPKYRYRNLARSWKFRSMDSSVLEIHRSLINYEPSYNIVVVYDIILMVKVY